LIIAKVVRVRIVFLIIFGVSIRRNYGIIMHKKKTIKRNEDFTG